MLGSSTSTSTSPFVATYHFSYCSFFFNTQSLITTISPSVPFPFLNTTSLPLSLTPVLSFSSLFCPQGGLKATKLIRELGYTRLIFGLTDRADDGKYALYVHRFREC